jgi:hypothetical protein
VLWIPKRKERGTQTSLGGSNSEVAIVIIGEVFKKEFRESYPIRQLRQKVRKMAASTIKDQRF